MVLARLKCVMLCDVIRVLSFTFLLTPDFNCELVSVWFVNTAVFLLFQTYDCLGYLTKLRCLRLECGRSDDGLGRALKDMHRYTLLLNEHRSTNCT